MVVIAAGYGGDLGREYLHGPIKKNVVLYAAMGKKEWDPALPQPPVRLDKWLWAARFFKTRAQAQAAVQGGKVQLNGARSKPGKVLNAGDELRIQRGEEIFVVTVTGISDRRGPVSQAQSLYHESDENRQRRESEARRRAALRDAQGAAPERRPDKRDRRLIRKFLERD